MLKELQDHQGKWIGVKDKRILISETRMGLESKLNGNYTRTYQIPRMYSGYQAWRSEVEEVLKGMLDEEAVQRHEEAPFLEESEDEVKLRLETESLKEEKPKRSFLDRILGI